MDIVLCGALPQALCIYLSNLHNSHKRLFHFPILKLRCQERLQDGGEREEAESEPPIVKSWRDAGDTLVGIITEKRHNFDPSTPPAGAENLHFMLNRETSGAPGRQLPTPRRLGKMRTR
jgi:hypothetical protein